jgi:hypothetical protein
MHESPVGLDDSVLQTRRDTQLVLLDAQNHRGKLYQKIRYREIDRRQIIHVRITKYGIE